MKTIYCDGCGATLPHESDGHPTLRFDALDMLIDVQLRCVCPRSEKELDLCVFCTRRLIDQMKRPKVETMDVFADRLPAEVVVASEALNRLRSISRIS